MFSERRVGTTDELYADSEARKEEWIENAGKHLLTGGAQLLDCETCRVKDESHKQHATIVEIAAHEAALAWLITRRQVAVS
jgi:hypothetical protein